MFDRFHARRDIDTSGARIHLRHGGIGAAAAAAARQSAHARDVAQDRAAARRAVHGRGDGPARLRRQLQARRRRRPHRLLVPHDGEGPGRGDEAARVRPLVRRGPRSRRARGASHGARPSAARARRSRSSTSCPRSHAEQHPAQVGGRFVPLVLHGAALRLSREDDRGLRLRALHPQEARQEGRGHERLHARGAGRVHPLLQRRKHPRGVRGLSRGGRHRSRARRSRPRDARSRCRCWCCGASGAT